MTELEQRLLTAFDQLSAEFNQRLSERDSVISGLSQQVQDLSLLLKDVTRYIDKQNNELMKYQLSVEAELKKEKESRVAAEAKLREDLGKALGILGKLLTELAES